MHGKSLAATSLAAILALPVAGRAQPAGMDPMAYQSLRVSVVMLVNVAQVVSGASATYASRTGRAPASMQDLVATGLLRPSDLQVTPVVRPGASWRIVDRGGPEAEVALASNDLAAPDCRVAAVMAGGDRPDAQFGCRATPDGVVFRYHL